MLEDAIMKREKSILVVVDRGRSSSDALAKAVFLARKFGARIELFMCDAERAYVLSQAYVQAGVEQARSSCIESAHRYLDGLAQSVAADGVQISIDAICESPLYEGIIRKALRERPDLLIKSAEGLGGSSLGGLDPTDWHLMRACPTTLMLARGRPWRERPRFAAAIDVSGEETAGLASDIVEAGQLLGASTAGELEILYAEPPGLDNASCEHGSRSLQRLVGALTSIVPDVHILAGNPEESLPAFAKRRAYDAMLLGALTHRPGITAQVGTLTSRLIEALGCDFILVKPRTYQAPNMRGTAKEGAEAIRSETST